GAAFDSAEAGVFGVPASVPGVEAGVLEGALVELPPPLPLPPPQPAMIKKMKVKNRIERALVFFMSVFLSPNFLPARVNGNFRARGF
ncbi:MAG TPA: hypothetical protein VLS90_07295, partial [Thermodesulfobacteriota bacterium]|nr:hypothetical protein [Thermodesulfobacteriota bacterium]